MQVLINGCREGPGFGIFNQFLGKADAGPHSVARATTAAGPRLPTPVADGSGVDQSPTPKAARRPTEAPSARLRPPGAPAPELASPLTWAPRHVRPLPNRDARSALLVAGVPGAGRGGGGHHDREDAVPRRRRVPGRLPRCARGIPPSPPGRRDAAPLLGRVQLLVRRRVRCPGRRVRQAGFRQRGRARGAAAAGRRAGGRVGPGGGGALRGPRGSGGVGVGGAGRSLTPAGLFAPSAAGRCSQLGRESIPAF